MKKTAPIKKVRPGKYANQARQVFLAFRGDKYYGNNHPRVLKAYMNHFQMQKEN